MADLRTGGNTAQVTFWYRFCCVVVFSLSRLAWGIRVEGRNKIPAEGPVLIVCNHISLLDPPVLGSVIPRESGFAAKKELFAGIMGRLVRSLNAIPVDRSRLSMETMEILADFMRIGRVLVFFPEGTRSKDGRLKKAKVGVGVLLQRCPATVVPAYIQGTNAPFRNLFRRGRVRIAFGDPFALPRDESTPSDSRAEARQIAETVYERIRELSERQTAS